MQMKSNIFNLLAILGITGLITPLVVQSSTVWKEIPLSFLAIIMTYFLANDFISSTNPTLSFIDGLCLFALFGFFLFYVYKQLKTDPAKKEESTVKEMATWKIAGLIIIGLAGLIFGGKMVVTNAVEIATTLGVSQKIIGLTIVAIGTSLPELITSIVAALKKKSDIAVGNIIGSNIFNVFAILGVSAIIKPIAYNDKFNFDLYVLGAGTLFLFGVMFIHHNKTITKWKAAILLVGYIVYTVILIGHEI